MIQIEPEAKPFDFPSNSSFLLDDCRRDNRVTTSHASPPGSIRSQLVETQWSHDAGAVSIQKEHYRGSRVTKCLHFQDGSIHNNQST